MNDRFKFRFWRYNPVEEKQVRVSSDLMDTDGYAQPYELFEDSAWCNYDDCICEQCTGLKDKNGKLIYEGDIVKAFGFKDYYKLVCRFRDSSFCLDHIDGSPYNFAHSVSPVEVIGNIHKNPELLEVGGK